jgi:hypothetical protein
VAGALPEAELYRWAWNAGFVDGRITERFDSFGGTRSGAQVSPRLGLQGMNFAAVAG